MRIFILILLLFFRFNVLGQQIDSSSVIENGDKIIEVNKFINYFKNFDLKDTLIICAMFSECGEWGGHKEYFKINKDSNNQFIATFIKDAVPCKEGYLENLRKIIYQHSRKLTIAEISLIQNYLNALLKKGKMDPDYFSNSGDLFYAKSKDLSISFFGFDCCGFDDLKKTFFKNN